MSDRFHYYLIFAAMVLLAGLETYCGTEALKDYQHPIETVSKTYFLSGLALAILALFKPKLHNPLPSGWALSGQRINRLLWIGFSAYLLLHLVYWARPVFEEYRIDPQFADMLPVIKTMSQRWIDGQPVYDNIAEIWNGIRPRYLPAMWMPYIPAQFMGIDVRWTSVLLLWLGTVIAASSIRRQYSLLSILPLAGLFYVLNFLFVRERQTLGWSEEPVVYAYFLLLGFALSRRSYWLSAVAVGLCLLSRYALAFWVPVMGLFIWWRAGFPQAVKWEGILAAMLVLLLFLPFGWDKLELFYGTPGEYIEQARRVWTSETHHVYKTLGLAKFFSIEQIPLLHRLVLILGLAAPLTLLGLFLLLHRRIGLHAGMFGLASLKITLVVIFNFLEIPYLYLFFSSTLLTYPLLLAYLQPEET